MSTALARAGRVGALVIAFSALVLWSPPPGLTHHYQPIQPGAMFRPSGCTLNFIFKGTKRNEVGERLYVGAAAHCIKKKGKRVRMPGGEEFGTVVFGESAFLNRFGEVQALDFTLIEIDKAKYRWVDPAVRFWGGPTGIRTNYDPPVVTLHYGQGMGFSQTEFSRPRVGIIEYVKSERYWGEFRGWYVAAHPIGPGDSGSPLLSADGEAVGTLNLLAAADKGVVSGPTLPLIIEALRLAGFDLDLVTAPYPGVGDPAKAPARAANSLEHCVDEPIGDPEHPDACIRSGIP